MTPNLLYALARMGHGDTIAIVDRNYVRSPPPRHAALGEERVVDGVQFAGPGVDFRNLPTHAGANDRPVQLSRRAPLDIWTPCVGQVPVAGAASSTTRCSSAATTWPRNHWDGRSLSGPRCQR
ncbi:RbsD/FucU domain-containing protein [Streptomyces niphimycinicus]|uniref:RbsD/FucU domain-containing protein n=1 Tax=Streptomyces niphimycinicus TaxID=2842201 RepID=UPI00263A8827|nr:RbsD/FucU domain-containing protein [Streptomyces niphimycinicus]